MSRPPDDATAPHVIIRGAEWVLSAERARGAPDARYGVACMLCEAASEWADNDPKPVGMWALHHTQQHPAHRQFLATSQRHWRVDRVASVPAPPPPPATERPPRHARARPTRRALRAAAHRCIASAGRFAGPLVVLSFITGGGLLGFLLCVATEQAHSAP